MLRAWRGEHGNWCPGYQRPPHAAADLTVDHIVPLAAGAASFDIADTAVLCRSCNSTKGASLDPEAQQDALAGALDAIGWVQQVVVNRRTGFVVDGHARVALAQSRGEPSVPVLYVDLTPDEEALVLATLDPIGRWPGATTRSCESSWRTSPSTTPACSHYSAICAAASPRPG